MNIAPSLRRLAGLGLNAEQLAAALTIIADVLDEAAASAVRAMTGAERMQRHRLRSRIDDLEADVRLDNSGVTKSDDFVTPQSDISTSDADIGRQLAIARKALTVTTLSANAARVGGVLLDHFNRATGRCDPGLNGVAGRLGRDVRHIRRGIGELVAAGFLVVRRHGGQHHCNAYEPQWDALAAAVERFESMSGLVVVSRDGQSDNPDGFVRQTQKKIINSTRVERTARDPRQRELLLPMSGGQTAAQQAKVRLLIGLDAHLRRFGPGFADRSKAEIDDGTWDAAVRAEINRRDSGLDVLLDALGPKAVSTGPPPASATG